MIPLHHEAPGDPTLLRWIQERIDHFISLEPAAVVVVFGFVLVLIPAAILTAYFLNRRRQSAE